MVRLTHTDSFGHISKKSKAIIEEEFNHGCNTYSPVPVVLERGYKARVWDVDGREYLDFLAGNSAVNQGHCHPKLLATLTAQAEKLTVTSRAFHTSLLAEFQTRLCNTFGYDRVLPMNSGAEGGETAVKLARRWGHDVKGIPLNCARVVFPRGNFWGRTIAAASTTSDPNSRVGFGPYTPGFDLVDYNNLEQLEAAVSHPHVCAFMTEPVQGEAGIIIPSDGYLRGAKEICKKYNVLLIVDEVQAGLGRSGKMLCSDHDNVKPDMVILGKSLSGGMCPVSAVLGSDEVLGLIKPGQHGSTFGGNQLACALGLTALDVIEEEGLCENSMKMGKLMRDCLRKDDDSGLLGKILTEVRGRGLMNAIVVNDLAGEERTAWEVCLEMARLGVLSKPTHGHIIRLTPPLCIGVEEIEKGSLIIREALRVVASRYVGKANMPF